MYTPPPPPPAAPPPPPPPPYGTGGTQPYGGAGTPPPYGGAGTPPPYGQYPTEQGYYQPMPPPVAKTNTMAVVSFVTGLVGIGIAAIVTGIIALRQIGRTGEKGKGLAIAGLVLAAVWTVVSVVVTLAVLGLIGGAAVTGALDGPSSSPSSGTTDDTDTGDGQFGMQVGECINRPGESSSDIYSVACSTPHDAEVYDVWQHPGGAFPGEEVLGNEAETRCVATFADYVGIDYNDSKFMSSYYTPSAGTWADGDRESFCIVYDEDGQTTGSLRNAGY